MVLVIELCSYFCIAYGGWGFKKNLSLPICNASFRKASSIGVQLAFAAGDGVTLALLMAFVLSLQYQMEATRSRVERPSRPRLIDGAGAQR